MFYFNKVVFFIIFDCKEPKAKDCLMKLENHRVTFPSCHHCLMSTHSNHTASVAALALSKEQEASQQGLLENAREENNELYEKAAGADTTRLSRSIAKIQMLGRCWRRHMLRQSIMVAEL